MRQILPKYSRTVSEEEVPLLILSNVASQQAPTEIREERATMVGLQPTPPPPSPTEEGSSEAEDAVDLTKATAPAPSATPQS